MKNNFYFFLIIIFIPITSCQLLSGAYHTLVFLDSAGERLDLDGQIEIIIENRSNETLILYVSGFNTGAELARISQNETKNINITKGRSIYINGGNTKMNYMRIICDNDREIFIIR